MDGINPSMKSIGVSYAYVRRRNRLPDPVEKEKGVSLWSMIKDNIGKDLTKVCLPVYFNEPLSSLQKCFEDLEYSYLIDRASEWGKRVLLLPLPASTFIHAQMLSNMLNASRYKHLVLYFYYIFHCTSYHHELAINSYTCCYSILPCGRHLILTTLR
jgi:hypothetical protein